MHYKKSLTATWLVLAFAGTADIAAKAGMYQALCAGGGQCTVTLLNGQIGIPGTVINSEDVLSWSQGGSGSKTDIGMGVGSVVLFGLPGIIGFGAKKHDYQYFINYVDKAGNGQMATVQFKNSVPANQFMMEMMGMTGLSMGELNKSAHARLKRNQSATAEQNEDPKDTSQGSSGCAPALKAYKCSWTKYVDANPSAKRWAAANPQLVGAEKARLGASD